MGLRSRAVVGWSVLTLLAGSAGLRAQTITPAAPPSVTILFDGSGSMWGKLDNERQTKLVLAREAIRKILPALNQDARIGLASYGHRRQADCSDVQVLQAPEKLDAERINGHLERLNPKGKGPIAAGLKEAAKSLSGLPGAKSIVLIHDDADNCQQDVCAAASEIATQQPGLQIHVIAMGLRKEDVARMSCVASATQGRLFDAQNAGQIANGIEDALTLAAPENAPATAKPPPMTAIVVQPPAPQPAVRPAAAAPPPGQVMAVLPVPATGPPALYLRATLATNTAPIEHPIRWTVKRLDATAPAKSELPAAPFYSGHASTAVVPAAPGTYEVEARDGISRQVKTVTLTDKGPIDAGIVLNAGIIRPKALAQKGGKEGDGAVFTIREAAAQDGGAGKVLATLSGTDAYATLPAGTYMMRADRGPVRAERAVQVPAGSDGPVEFVLATAHLTLGVGGADSTLAPLFIVYEDDPDAPRGRKEIARSASTSADFVLPAGTYAVVARVGAVEARERVTLAPGDVQKRQIALQPARILLSSRFAGTSQAIAENVSYRIEKIDTVPPEITHVSNALATIDLAAGTYRVESRVGLLNARASRDVTVAVGRATDLVFEHEAGALNLRLAAGIAGDVHWDVRDSDGKIVWISGQPEPKLVLQAGRYSIRGETRDKRFQRDIVIKSGAMQTIEFKE
jgi:Ca-activated chloride channel homolog